MILCVCLLQLCASWKKCCSWTRRSGSAPPRLLILISSPSSETLTRRPKLCRMIRPWTTQTCSWTSGNVRGDKAVAFCCCSAGIYHRRARKSKDNFKHKQWINNNIFLFCRPHIHRNTDLQTSQRLQRDATLGAHRPLHYILREKIAHKLSAKIP